MRTIFRGFDGTNEGLFVSDGTANGTRLLLSGTSEVFVDPADLVAAGGLVYFRAQTQDRGRELWATDGTPEGTRIVADIETGRGDGAPTELTALGETIWFTAYTRNHGVELWRSDGTTAGTVRVTDLNPGEASARPSALVAVGDTLFFVADDGTHGRELYAGDAAGIRRLADIGPGAVGANATALTAVGDRLFFVADDGDSGRELWVSDGTSAGTRRVADIRGGAEGAATGALEGLGARVLFRADDGVSGAELWLSDGTQAGTMRLADIAAGAGASSPRHLTRVGERVFFVADDGATGAELWVSDGTSAGTRLVADVLPGLVGSNPRALTAVGDTLFFLAEDASRVATLWASDGTSAGTRLLEPPGGFVGAPSGLRAVGDELYFSADDGVYGRELWASDGTSAGTRLVANVRRDGFAANLEDLAPLGDALVTFGGSNGLFLFDTSGLRQLSEVNAGRSFNPLEYYLPLDGALLFIGSDAAHGVEPWITDGSSAGTVMLADLRPGVDGSSVRLHAAWNGLALFSASDGGGQRLYVTDGTPAGTEVLASVPVDSLQILGAGAVFAASGALWRTDGTPAGTQNLSTELGQLQVTGWTGLHRIGEQVFFQARGDSATGFELWSTDGTAAGTMRGADITPGPNSTQFNWIRAIGDRLVFSANDGVHGNEIWASDGTEAGTTLLVDATPGATGNASIRGVFGDRFVISRDGLSEATLWISDGTVTGTTPLDDWLPAGASGSIGGIVGPAAFTLGDYFVFPTSLGETWLTDGTQAGTRPVWGTWAERVSFASPLGQVGQLTLFASSDSAHGVELWATDFTPDGTRLVADIRPGPSGSGPRALGVFGDWIYFMANDGVNGPELWRSDGTPEGTTLLGNIVPGDLGSAPTEITPIPQLRALYTAGATVALDAATLESYDLIARAQGDLASAVSLQVTSGGTIDLADELGARRAFLHLTSAEDGVIRTGAGDDYVVAGRGNDAAFTGLGDDLLDGGLGRDEAQWGTARAEVQLRSFASGDGRIFTQVRDLSGAEGLDTAVAFETLSFAGARYGLAGVQQNAVANLDGGALNDVLFQNAVGGAVVYVDASAGGGFAPLLPALPSGWSVRATGDLSNDGRAEAIVQSAEGHVYTYAIGAGWSAVASLSAEWTLLGVGDCTGDAMLDLLVHHADGRVYLQDRDLDGGSVWSVLPGFGGARFVGIGDLDGDGRSDIVLADEAAGTVTYADIDDGRQVGTVTVASGLAGTGWEARGVGDLTGDGHADVVFRNAVTGQAWAVDICRRPPASYRGRHGLRRGRRRGSLHAVGCAHGRDGDELGAGVTPPPRRAGGTPAGGRAFGRCAEEAQRCWRKRERGAARRSCWCMGSAATA